MSLWLPPLLALLDEAPRHDAELLAVYQGFPAQTTKSFAAFLYYESFGKGRKENDNAKAVSFRTEKSRKRMEETTGYITLLHSRRYIQISCTVIGIRITVAVARRA